MKTRTISTERIYHPTPNQLQKHPTSTSLYHFNNTHIHFFSQGQFQLLLVEPRRHLTLPTFVDGAAWKCVQDFLKIPKQLLSNGVSNLGALQWDSTATRNDAKMFLHIRIPIFQYLSQFHAVSTSTTFGGSRITLGISNPTNSPKPHLLLSHHMSFTQN